MKYTLKTLSILFSYPGEELYELASNIDALYELLSSEDKEAARLIREFLEGVDIDKIDEVYVSIFEMPAKCSLYSHTYIVKEKEGELGRFLLEIKGHYKVKGYDIQVTKEIPDYLPAMLEFLSIIIDTDPRAASKFARRYVKPMVRELTRCIERNNRTYLPLAKALSIVIDRVT
ncbi:MAG: nitrate reductase molybdenum cofactor assembly chaperone [Desulfurococcales archaeon]|nr:nitrate reductase molybdenum cofactor assembly chaperone [Desulfurococcales archaeon]